MTWNWSAINDLGDAKANALLFKRDSVHGNFAGTVEVDGNDLVINGKRIHVTAERDPANLPHAANGVRHRTRMHRHSSPTSEGERAPHRRRQARHHFRSGKAST
jgi:hypothetical protein